VSDSNISVNNTGWVSRAQCPFRLQHFLGRHCEGGPGAIRFTIHRSTGTPCHPLLFTNIWHGRPRWHGNDTEIDLGRVYGLFVRPRQSPVSSILSQNWIKAKKKRKQPKQAAIDNCKHEVHSLRCCVSGGGTLLFVQHFWHSSSCFPCSPLTGLLKTSIRRGSSPRPMNPASPDRTRNAHPPRLRSSHRRKPRFVHAILSRAPTTAPPTPRTTAASTI
jgi:hypothetical protein